MHRNSPLLTAGTAFFLAVALTLSGALSDALAVIVLTALLPRMSVGATMNFSELGAGPVIGLLSLAGGALTLPLARIRNWRVVSGVVLTAWPVAVILFGLSLWHFHWNPDAVPGPPLVLAGTALSLLPVSSLLYATWVWRSSGKQINALTLLAFFFLGSVGGDIGYRQGVAVYLDLKEQIVWGSIFFAIAGLVFFCVHYCLTRIELPDEVAQASPLVWMRRLRWMLLGGLPRCAVSGVATYLIMEVSAIPLFLQVSLVFSDVAWVVAFARMSSTRKVTTAGRIAQVLVALVILLASAYFLGLLRSESAHTRDHLDFGVDWCVLLYAVFQPHRFTLMMQSGLLVLVLLEVFAGVPFDLTSLFGIFSICGTHLLLCVVICWGCYGDAVKDAAADRLPEFWLCVQGGNLVCGFAYQVLPPLLVPASWGQIEYPLVLVACLVVRVWRGPGRQVSFRECSSE